MTLTVNPRFRGPTTSGNGGYVSGIVAAAVGAPAVTVTLRVPPPLDVAMDMSVVGGTVHVTAGATTVADATRADVAELVDVPPVPVAEAREVSRTYPGLRRHPFPQCFVCGPERDPGDGMRLFPGRLDDGRSACVWDVAADLAGHAEFVWASLDCPGGWAAPIEGRPMVLGRMTAMVETTPEAGEACVVMGRVLGSEGRKVWTATTAYGADARILGRARATWITIAPSE